MKADLLAQFGVLADAYLNAPDGVDAYCYAVSVAVGVSIGSVTPKQRATAKLLLFGVR